MISLSDCLDITKLKKLCEEFYKTFEVPHGIMDIDGSWVVTEGWQRACTEYFRQHPYCEELCIKSDGRILEKINDNILLEYATDTCDHGLEHVCYPIVVRSQRIGTFWLGQFFYESPDLEMYRSIARKYSFDENDFLGVIASSPVISRDYVDKLMGFFMQLVGLLADQGYEVLLRKESETQLLQLKNKLEVRVNDLERFLPLCSFCKKIRDDKGEWTQVDHYIHEHLDANVSHTFCPECVKLYYPEFADKVGKK